MWLEKLAITFNRRRSGQAVSRICSGKSPGQGPQKATEQGDASFRVAAGHKGRENFVIVLARKEPENDPLSARLHAPPERHCAHRPMEHSWTAPQQTKPSKFC
jgi:hypothetical protein